MTDTESGYLPYTDTSKANSNIYLTDGMDPKKEADVLSLSRKTGLKPALVREKKQDVLNRVYSSLIDDLKDKAPKTVDYYADFDKATISKGDYEKLSNIEQIHYLEQQIKKDEADKEKADAIGRAILGVPKSIGRTLLRTVPTILKSGADMLTMASGPMEKMTSEASKKGPSSLLSVVMGGTSPDLESKMWGTLNQGARGVSKFQKEVLSQKFMNLPKEKQVSLWDKPSLLADPEWLVQNVGEAANSMIPVFAAAVFGGPAAGAFVGGGMEAGGLYDELVTDGVDPRRAGVASAAYGTVSGLLNKIGLDSIMKKVPAKKILQKIGHRVVAGTTEGVSEWMEEPFQAAFAGLAKGKPADQIEADVYQAMKNIDVIPGSFLIGAGLHSITNHEKATAEKTAAYHEKINKAVNESATKTISPIASEDHLKFVGVESAYLTPEGIETLYQTEKPDEILERIGLSDKQARESLLHGQDIKLNMAKVHAALSPEEYAMIHPDIKESPAALSKRQADSIDIAKAEEEVTRKVTEAETKRKEYLKEVARVRQEAVDAGYDKSMADTYINLLDKFSYTQDQKTDFVRKIKIQRGEDGMPGVLYHSAWHGTPHDFEKFSMDKIGTGEGAQAYGHGLYFAGSEDVAKFYKEKLSGNTGTIYGHISEIHKSLGGDDSKTRDFFNKKINGENVYSKEDKKIIKSLLKSSKTINEFLPEKGNLFKVDLAPNEDEYLDWDKPLNEQSEKVKKALTGVSEKYINDYTDPEKAIRDFLETDYAKSFPDVRDVKWAKTILTNPDYDIKEDGQAWLEAQMRSGVGSSFYNLLGSKHASSFYERLAKDIGGQKKASEYLKSIGIRGIKYLDGSSRGKGEGSHNYVIFDENDIKIVEKNNQAVLYQSQEAQKLASVRIADDQYIITLFQGANISSIIHETGHIFMNELETLANLPDASEQIKEDWNKALDWLGAKPGEPLTTEQKEQFARGFEAYMFEGKSPTQALDSVFERFRKWLVRVYGSIRALDVDLNDDIRGVFDRMLGAEMEFKTAEEINGFTPMTKDEMDALGIVPDDRKYLDRLQNKASQDAEIAMHKARNASLREKIKQWKKEAKDKVDLDPGQRQADDLSQFGGADIDELVEKYGEGILDVMPKRVPPVFKKGGMSLNEAAYSGGFDSVDQMIDTLKTVKKKSEAVKEIVDQKIREHDAQFAAIDFIVDSDAYRTYMEVKAKYMERSGGRETGSTPQEAYKTYARKMFSQLRVSAATGISRYLSAVRKFAGIEREKIRLNKIDEAIDANEKFRLNYEFTNLSAKFREHVQKVVKRANTILGSSIDNAHKQQALKLIQRFGLTDRVITIDEDAPTFADFMSKIESQSVTQSDSLFDIAPVWSETLMNESYVMPFEKLTVDEFNELGQALDYLKRRGGKVKNKTLLIGKQTILSKVHELVNTILNRKTGKKVYAEDSIMRKITDQTRWYFAQHDTLIFLARRLDGFVSTKGETGPVERFISKQLNEAENNYAVRYRAFFDKFKTIAEHFQERAKAYGKVIKTDIEVPEAMRTKGMKWTFERVLMMAMHQGNEVNQQRLRDGYGMTQEDIQSLLDSVLTKEDWMKVQETWDAINSLWPDLDAVFYRLNDFHQKKVDAQKLTLKDGTVLNGGYFPLKYDSSLSDRVGEWTEKDDILNSYGAMFPSTNPKANMLKGRVTGAVSMPLSLNLNVIQQHVETSLRYITHAEVLTDIHNVTKHSVFKAAVTDKEGEHVYKNIRPALGFIANPRLKYEQLNSFIMKQANRATTYSLFLNFRSAAQQLFGSMTSFSQLGDGNTALGAARFLSGVMTTARKPLEAYNAMLELSDFMRQRQKEGIDRDMARSIELIKPNNLSIKGYTLEDARNFGFSLLQIADMISVTPVWHAAFEKAMRTTNGDIKEAVSYADDVIRTTQESRQAQDLNPFQRSYGWHRLFTLFSTFAHKYGALQRYHYNAWREGTLSTPKYLSVFLTDQIAQPLLISLAMGLLWGDKEPDLEDAAFDVLEAQFMGMFAIRETVGGAIRQRDKFASKVDSPALMGFNMLLNVVSDLVKITKDLEDEQKYQKTALDLIELVSFGAGLPIPKVMRNIERGYQQYEDGGTIFNILAPDNRK